MSTFSKARQKLTRLEMVSIIIPTYNNVKTLQESLDSVLSQTYRPLEIIIIDDCSVDDSFAFAKAYALKNTSQNVSFITIKNNNNLGAGNTRNKGITAATGDYIAFLDADDLWKPHKLALQISEMKKQNASVCYGSYEIFNSCPKQPVYLQHVFKKLTFNKLLKANYIGHLTGIYHVKMLGKFYMPALRKRQDWAMWLDILRSSGNAIGIEQPIASYRQGAGLSYNKLELIPFNYAIYNKHLGYSAMNSCLLLLRFFYEQFFVKRKMRIKINN